jgi:hypothetical protein
VSSLLDLHSVAALPLGGIAACVNGEPTHSTTPIWRFSAGSLLSLRSALLARAPDTSRVAQFLEPVTFRNDVSHKLDPNLDSAPPGLVESEALNATGLIAWMFREELIAKICALIPDAGAGLCEK